MNKFCYFLLLFFAFTSNIAYCANFESIIKKSDIDKNAVVAFSVKEADTGKIVYQYNESKLMNPASVQKLFTMRVAYKELSPSFTFDTKVYKDANNNLYIKLAGDPSLATNDLKQLLKDVKTKINFNVADIVVDGSIHDNKEWGIGWMWDDDTNSLLPKYSPFSINNNKVPISIMVGNKNNLPKVINNSDYSMLIVNKLQNGAKDDVTFDRQPWLSSDLTYINGTVNKSFDYELPVESVKKYFLHELNSALLSVDLKHSGQVLIAPTPNNVELVATHSSKSLEDLLAHTLKDSDNFYSEMIFKSIGRFSQDDVASTQNAVDLFNQYYSDIKSKKPLVVDACGISRNNLMSADWATEALNKIYNENDFYPFSVLLPKPIEGTLANRLLNISLQLRAKTGTASNISSLAGFVDSKSGKKYSFAIFIQNHNFDTNKVKKFEDSLVNEIHKL